MVSAQVSPGVQEVHHCDVREAGRSVQKLLVLWVSAGVSLGGV